MIPCKKSRGSSDQGLAPPLVKETFMPKFLRALVLAPLFAAAAALAGQPFDQATFDALQKPTSI